MLINAYILFVSVTVVLEKTLEVPLDCKEIKPVSPKGNLSWIFIGRTDAEAEAPILWPPDGKNWLIEKDSEAGKDWGQEEKGTTEVEMVGWHHRLMDMSLSKLRQLDGQGSLVCCSSWGHKESDTTEWLNWAFERDNKTRPGEHRGKKGNLGVSRLSFSLAWFFLYFQEVTLWKIQGITLQKPASLLFAYKSLSTISPVGLVLSRTFHILKFYATIHPINKKLWSNFCLSYNHIVAEQVFLFTLHTTSLC